MGNIAADTQIFECTIKKYRTTTASMNQLYRPIAKAFAFVSLSAFSLSTSAQIVTKETVKGSAKENYEMAYISRNMALSDSLALLAVKEKPNFIDGWLLVGDNKFFLKQYEEAAKAFEKVKSLKADYLYDIELKLAKSYVGSEQYAKAKSSIESFLAMPKLSSSDRMLAEKIKSDCEFAPEAMAHPVPFKPVNIDRGVNTPLNEAGPYLTADGQYVYYTRLEEERGFIHEDIYCALKTNNGFAEGKPLGSTINTFEGAEGSVCISSSGKYLFFTAYDRPDGVGNADIYIARKVDDKWERANNMGTPINTPGFDGSPSLSADGRTLFFSSVRSGGLGQRDIWMTTLKPDGGWNTPVNMGDSINTPFNDESPYIHPDGKTLYFSSNGRPGMGNYDLYVSNKLPNGKWSKAKNLGYPINTSGYEVSIFVTTDGGTAYYSSELKGGYGQMDIYKFDMPVTSRPEYTSYLKGNVYDVETRNVVVASAQIYDLETGNLFATLSGDKNNGLIFSTLPAGKNYAVVVMKDGYLFYSQNISLKDVKEGTPYEVNIALTKIKVGGKVVLNNVFFASDKAELKSESKSELDVLVKLLEKNPSVTIEIGGHTDNTGDEKKNLELSENRAKNVYDYLVSQGVAAERLSYKGYAASKPVAPNDSAENKAKNRRTEFTVTGI